MSQEYNAMSQMPSHGNASNARVANGREGFQRGGRGGAGGPPPQMGGIANRACQFAPPPPGRQYCTAAPFSSMNGMRYFTMGSAYGSSVPSMSNY